MNYDALLALMPDPYRAWVLAILQLLGALSVVVPALEGIVRLTATKRDDQALQVLQRMLSVLPRVTVPALSQRPPAPVSSDAATLKPPKV